MSALDFPFRFNRVHYVGAFLISDSRIKLSLLLEHLALNGTQYRIYTGFDVISSPTTSKEMPVR